jgi:hypothetical protein
MKFSKIILFALIIFSFFSLSFASEDLCEKPEVKIEETSSSILKNESEHVVMFFSFHAEKPNSLFSFTMGNYSHDVSFVEPGEYTVKYTIESGKIKILEVTHKKTFMAQFRIFLPWIIFIVVIIFIIWGKSNRDPLR